MDCQPNCCLLRSPPRELGAKVHHRKVSWFSGHGNFAAETLPQFVQPFSSSVYTVQQCVSKLTCGSRAARAGYEILSYFLEAESYPARDAREPQVSFETHCWTVYTELENGWTN